MTNGLSMLKKLNNVYIYCHIFPDKKKYFGMTQQLPKKRWMKGSGYKNQKNVYSAIQKFGWQNIEHIVLYEDIPYEQGRKIERFLIRFFKTNNPEYGYNIKEGDNKTPMAESSKIKLSGLRKQFYQEHPELKSILGFKKGSHHKEESKRKTSESMKKYCQEHPERAKRHSEMLRGRKKPFKECPKRCKKIICTDTGIIYNSLKEVTEKLGIPQPQISHCLRGDFHTTHGLHFEYYNEKEELK